MGFTKFALIFVISLAIVFTYATYREWKVDNLQKTYNYNFKDLGFWGGFFMSDHSAGYVYMWQNYQGLVLLFNFFWIFVVIYGITWKLSDD